MGDDHQFNQSLTAMLPRIKALLPDRWDVARLDCWGSYGRQPVAHTPKCEKNIHNCFGGTHAILYPFNSLKRVVRHLSREPWNSADMMFYTNNLRTFCVNLGIVRNISNLTSDIPKPYYPPPRDLNSTLNGTSDHPAHGEAEK